MKRSIGAVTAKLTFALGATISATCLQASSAECVSKGYERAEEYKDLFKSRNIFSATLKQLGPFDREAVIDLHKKAFADGHFEMILSCHAAKADTPPESYARPCEAAWGESRFRLQGYKVSNREIYRSLVREVCKLENEHFEITSFSLLTFDPPAIVLQ